MKTLKEKLLAFDWRMLCAAAVSLVVGIIILIRPETSALFLSYILAAFIALYGIVHTVMYFASKKPISPFSSESLAAGLTVLSLGIFLLYKPNTLLEILPVALGCLLIYLGFVSLQTAIDLIRKRAKQWYLPLLFALALLVCGLLVFINPFKTERGLMLFLGIALLAEFAMQIASLVLLNKRQKQPAAAAAEPAAQIV